MKIRSHSESHIVELDDGSRWRIFPGDLDVSLSWTLDTEITLLKIDDKMSSHALASDAGPVRVIAAGETWPVREVKTILKDG
jgi:hypothetical protein